MNRLKCLAINRLKFFLLATSLALSISGINGQVQTQTTSATTSNVNRLAVTLPAEGKMVNDKPVGEHWVNMLESLDGWNADPRYWSLQDGVLHGDYDGGKLREDTAIGIVFTGALALGLAILSVHKASAVDLEELLVGERRGLQGVHGFPVAQQPVGQARQARVPVQQGAQRLADAQGQAAPRH